MVTVITMPATGKDNLDRLAFRIKDNINKREQSREDWVEATLDLSVALAEARGHFPSNIAFGAWVAEQGFLLSPQDQAAFIGFGKDPELARVVLDKTESRSVREIFRLEFRSSSAGRTKKQQTRKGLTTSPKVQAALEAYDFFKASGIEPTREQVEQRASVSSGIAQRAFERRRVEAQIAGQQPDIQGMPKSWALKYEAAVRQLTRKLEAEYNQRRITEIERHINEYLMPLYRQKLERAERVMQVGKKPFSVDEYRQLLAALHPDSTVESRTKAFIMVKDREHMLRPPERDKPFTSTLPQTLEELLKRRKTKRQ